MDLGNFASFYLVLNYKVIYLFIFSIMAKTSAWKKKVYVEWYTYTLNGKKVSVPTHYRSTPN